LLLLLLLLVLLLLLLPLLPPCFRTRAFFVLRFCVDISRFCFSCSSLLFRRSFSNFHIVTFRLHVRRYCFAFALCLLVFFSSSLIFVHILLSFNHLC
jgi:hypothetical protein